MLHFNQIRGLIALVATLSAIPMIAKAANFGNLTLTPGFDSSTAVVTGATGGAYSLSSIANRDRNDNPCIGFGDPTPDHIMTLEKDFPKLKLQVNSRGNDTTLVIQGSNGTVRCGDDTGSNKDASITGTNWKAGNYEIWVGSFDAGQRWNYSLSAREE